MAVSDRIAVMSAGTIVQEGSAEDLYYRPASRFVAQFIGRVNLVPGRVESLAAGGGVIEALGARVTASSIAQGVARGDRVDLVVRPESVEIGAARAGGPGARGTIKSRSFLGEKIEYVVQCGELALQAVRFNAGPAALFEEGAEVAIGIPAEGLAAIAGAH